MKNNKKWNKVFLAGMAALVLAFGLILAGCSYWGDYDGQVEGQSAKTKLNLDSTSKYKFTSDGWNMDKGDYTVAANGKDVTFKTDGTGLVNLFGKVPEYTGTLDGKKLKLDSNAPSGIRTTYTKAIDGADEPGLYAGDVIDVEFVDSIDE
ncbi:hypothetical protein FACS1894106_1840 [Spirochaetia bacterium]|nr:hypothetical protein FACS1894106_1840 [Spirochaetia bacterium]